VNPAEAAPEVTHETFGPFTEREIDLADRILLLRIRPPFRACSIDALAELAQRAE
jgi:hypothetical protein